MIIDDLMGVSLPSYEGTRSIRGDVFQNQWSNETHNGNNYFYIPFVPNGINCVDVPNIGPFEVLSSLFSGCIMAIIEDRRGIMKVCHVSTGAGQDCKHDWEILKSNARRFIEFKPSDYVIAHPEGVRYCDGIISSNGNNIECFSLTIVGNGTVGGIIKVKHPGWRTNN